MFRITESVGVRIEDVGIEQFLWLSKKLMLDPGRNPGVQDAVFGIVEAIEGV